MGKTSHTQGQWELDITDDAITVDCNGKTIVSEMNGSPYEGEVGREEHIANYRRIVECVNACDGINPAGLPKVLAVLTKIVRHWQMNDPNIFASELATDVIDALDKADIRGSRFWSATSKGDHDEGTQGTV